jgi:hypothetical protein
MKWFTQTGETPQTYEELQTKTRGTGNYAVAQWAQLPDGRVGIVRDIRDGMCRIEADVTTAAKLATGWLFGEGYCTVPLSAVRVINGDEYNTWRRMLTEGRWVTRAQKEAAYKLGGVISEAQTVGNVLVTWWENNIPATCRVTPNGDYDTWTHKVDWQEHNAFIISHHGADAIRLQ